MGKQSKLKKMRKAQGSEIPKEKELNADQFVSNIEKHGYSLKKIKQSPEIPENRIEPKI